MHHSRKRTLRKSLSLCAKTKRNVQKRHKRKKTQAKSQMISSTNTKTTRTKRCGITIALEKNRPPPFPFQREMTHEETDEDPSFFWLHPRSHCRHHHTKICSSITTLLGTDDGLEHPVRMLRSTDQTNGLCSLFLMCSDCLWWHDFSPTPAK